jgi:uncharacterized protein
MDDNLSEESQFSDTQAATVTAPGGTAPGEALPVESTPVTVAERIDSVDTLRGFALLGILVMNIYFFALPGAVYFDPRVWGGAEGVNIWTWMATHILFEQKFMSIFSMLFGAGVVLMFQRAELRGSRFGRIWFRRCFWLLMIGLLHAYLLWYGDILFTYAVCGFMLYFFRRLSPWKLVVIGIVLMLVVLPLSSGLGLFMGFMRDTALEAEVLEAEGRDLNAMQRSMLDAWTEMKKEYYPTPEQLQEEVDLYSTGSYGEIFADRFPVVLNMQLVAGIINVYWHVGGLMLIGMGLMKSGVFAAERSFRFYRGMVFWGYGAGLPLAVWSVIDLKAHGFDFIHTFVLGGHFNLAAGLLIALGHVGLVMLVCKAGLFTALRLRMAAVGRMALTNYLMHTLICITLFYSQGFGLFGSLPRLPLMGVVLAIWIFQLSFCRPWLQRFRFGPAEWLWRSLTYRRLQPFRVQPETLPPA